MSDANKIILVADLESLSELDGRYVSLKCVNFAPKKPKRGEFSLVFSAHDKVEEERIKSPHEVTTIAQSSIALRTVNFVQCGGISSI